MLLKIVPTSSKLNLLDLEDFDELATAYAPLQIGD